MARYNEILVGRYNRFAQKLLGMKGGPPAPQLQSDIALNINFFHGRETFLHQGWTSWSGSQLITGVTGAAMLLRNPANSNNVVVVEKIQVTNRAAVNDQFTLQIGGAVIDFTSAGATVARDTRQPVSPANSPTIFSTRTNGFGQAGALVLMTCGLVPQGNFDFMLDNPEHELILSPSFAVSLAGGAVTGGQIMGAWPGLERGQLFEDRDLAPMTDLRAIAKGVLIDHFGLNQNALKTVFPGGETVQPMRGLIRAG